MNTIVVLLCAIFLAVIIGGSFATGYLRELVLKVAHIEHYLDSINTGLHNIAQSGERLADESEKRWNAEKRHD